MTRAAARIRACTCLCHESGPPDEHMTPGEKCPCKQVADVQPAVCRHLKNVVHTTGPCDWRSHPDLYPDWSTTP